MTTNEHTLPYLASPARHRDSARGAEQMLLLDEAKIEFVPLARPATTSSAAPESLLIVARLLEESFLLAGQPNFEIDWSEAAALWKLFLDRCTELMCSEGECRSVESLTDREMLDLITIVVSNGLTYDPLFCELGLNTEEPLFLQRVDRFVRFLFQLSRLAARDLRSLLWIARQPLKRHTYGVCRHYAAIVQLLFLLSSRFLSRPRTSSVITIGGKPSAWSLYGHAWNWFIPFQQREVAPFDLTTADWCYDRREAHSIFNDALDACAFPNASAFLATLLAHYSCVPGRLSESWAISRLFCQLLASGTQRGLFLLSRLLTHPMIAPEARAAISAHLRFRRYHHPFSRLAAAVERNAFHSLVRRVSASVWQPELQLELLQRAGVQGVRAS